MFKSKFKVLSLLKSFKYNNNNNIRTFRYQAKGISDKYQLLKNELLVISDEIRNSEKPVVALESTIITHGLPYPINLETALEVENEIRSENAIPATIAFLNGKLRVGLNKTEIEQVAKSHENALKISRRDLAYLFANHDDPKLVGGTTVSGTCIAAHAANIPIFCTGGIGGVHRDYTTSMDVSADLQELARTPVAVVSSGIKSILDIQRTLEYLETLGVCVYTLAESGTKELPAFFTSHSGFDAPYNCRNEIEAARMIHANLSTGLNMGMLIGVPIPSDHAANSDDIETAIQESLIEAKKLNIKGKKVTQFLLEKINKLTKGSSLASNIALIKNNARTSAKIAIELRKLQKNKPQNTFNIMQNKNKSSQKISLIGGINLDSTYKLTDEKTIHLKGVTQPVLASSCLGGVARNMAEALIKLGAKDSILFSSVARDVAGKYVTEESNSIGFDTSKWLVLDDPTLATGSYNAIFDTRGELLFGCGDMRAHNLILPEYIEQHRQEIEESALCIIDADIPVETILFITNICEEKNIPIWYNPTDLRKSTKIVDAGVFDKITFMSPNTKELFAIFNSVFQKDKSLGDDVREHYKVLGSKYSDIFTDLDESDLNEILKYLVQYVPVIILSRGKKNLKVACAYDVDLEKSGQFPNKENLKDIKTKNKKHIMQPVVFDFPVLKFEDNEKYMNESGAGDSMSSGIIYGILNDYTLSNTIYNGVLSAKLALLTTNNVNEEIGNINLEKLNKITDMNRDQIKKQNL